MIRIGQKLREERLRRGFTLEEVAKATKIKVSFLSSIEKGEYYKLPSSTYAQGFVRNYAQYLELPKGETLALFRREFDEEKVFRVLPEGFSKQENFPLKRSSIAQSAFVIFTIFGGIAAYLLFAYRYAFLNPPLDVYSPSQNQSAEESLVVTGRTDPNATVFVNGTAVTLDDEGRFKKIIDMFPGKGSVRVRAVNKFGRQTVVERIVEVKGN